MCPDQLNPTLLKTYFADRIDSHSWSTVKLDRCGLQFFYDGHFQSGAECK